MWILKPDWSNVDELILFLSMWPDLNYPKYTCVYEIILRGWWLAALGLTKLHQCQNDKNKERFAHWIILYCFNPTGFSHFFLSTHRNIYNLSLDSEVGSKPIRRDTCGRSLRPRIFIGIFFFQKLRCSFSPDDEFQLKFDIKNHICNKQTFIYNVHTL